MTEPYRETAPNKYVNYLRRADGFFRAAKSSFDLRDLDIAVSSSVHCAISAADALCVYKLRKRSASDSHMRSVELFAGLDAECKEQSKRLSRLLSLKSAAEYSEDIITEKDAARAFQDAERFLHFVKSKLPT